MTTEEQIQPADRPSRDCNRHPKAIEREKDERWEKVFSCILALGGGLLLYRDAGSVIGAIFVGASAYYVLPPVRPLVKSVIERVPKLGKD